MGEYRTISRAELPESVRQWLDWLEESSLDAQSRIQPDTITIHQLGEEDISLSFDVDFFEFVKTIERFPNEYDLYSASVNTETVYFQFKLKT